MKNKITSILLAMSMLVVFAACNKDDAENSPAGNSAGSVGNQQMISDDGENPDAWWQQYTTKPSGTTKPATTKKGLFGNKKETTTKKPETTKKASSTTKAPAPAEPYTKVDADTMKYTVKDSNGKTGVVTLTKSASNAYIKQAIAAVNNSFGTSYTAANAICYNSTLEGMAGFNLVYIFSSTSKSASNLQMVIQFSGENAISFVGMTVTDEAGTSQEMEFPYWPIATSGNETYTSYLETFKTACEDAQSGYYEQGTNTFKIMLDGDIVKIFLTW